jgi:hypothetical protein
VAKQLVVLRSGPSASLPQLHRQVRLAVRGDHKPKAGELMTSLIKPTLACLAVLTLASCANRTSQPPQPKPKVRLAREAPKPPRPTPVLRSEVEVAERTIRRKLNDPESARFEGLQAGINGKGLTIVCGWVNAKNGNGGYTGQKAFMVALEPRPSTTVVGSLHGSNDVDENIIWSVCEGLLPRT